MTQPTQHGPAELDLSREQAWVLHAAVLDYVDAEREVGNEPAREVSLLRAIESGGDLTDGDAARIAELLATYLDGAPAMDLPHGRAVLDAVETARSRGYSSPSQ
ncbi:MAG: hypothetical protein ABEJ78_01440 [Haloferacaceae archaeon]